MKINIKRIYDETDKYLNQEIEIVGWIRTLRSSKKFGFIEINDGTFFSNLQIVFDEELENFKEVEKYSISTAISVKGILVETPGAKQPFEIQAKEILLLKSRINEILQHHTGQPLERIERDTDRDYYMSAQAAAEYGLIDGVLTRKQMAADQQ